jgi:hypothetical protein
MAGEEQAAERTVCSDSVLVIRRGCGCQYPVGATDFLSSKQFRPLSICDGGLFQEKDEVAVGRHEDMI